MPFVQDRFAIGFWVDPPRGQRAEQRYREIADAGFTVVLAGFQKGPSATLFRLLKKFNLKAILWPEGTDPTKWASDPTLWGYAGQLTAAASWSSLPWLHRVHNPTLVISGGSDRIVPPINARILACRIPDSRLQIVEGAGHLLLLDHAELCAAAISEFLVD